VGPGDVALTWRSDQGPKTVPYAHNEYLQILLQLGVVGLVLLLGLLTVVVRAVWQARAAAVSPELWAGAVGGLAALSVHSGFDFLWHLPAIPLIAALLLALTHPATQPHHTNQPRPQPDWPLGCPHQLPPSW
jgi:O-antigen ligase